MQAGRNLHVSQGASPLGALLAGWLDEGCAGPAHYSTLLVYMHVCSVQTRGAVLAWAGVEGRGVDGDARAHTFCSMHGGNQGIHTAEPRLPTPLALAGKWGCTYAIYNSHLNCRLKGGQRAGSQRWAPPSGHQ